MSWTIQLIFYFLLLLISDTHPIFYSLNYQVENCYLETTKVLKFPKIFDHLQKNYYLCTLFVIWRNAHPLH